MKSLVHFDQTINKSLQDWHIPGAAVAIVKDEETLYMKGHGLRDIELGLPITENTRFPIASMTKTFTAMGAAILVDEGLLSWDQPVRDLMPGFRLADDYATARTTLRDLLSHRTGLPRHDATWYGTHKTQQELYDGLRHLKSSADFRSLWQYNNLMYEVVGLMCAQASGAESWESFIQNRVIDPLGLTSTTANAEKAGSTRFSDIALPYRLKNGENEPHRIPVFEHNLGPAGSIHSTLTDMITWIKVHTNRGLSKGVQLVSEQNLGHMHTPQMLIEATAQQISLFNNKLFSYGLGWFIEPYQGVTLCHHGGNVGGFSLITGFVPQENIGLVVLTNIKGTFLTKALMYEALDRVLGVDSGKTKDWISEYLKLSHKSEQEELNALVDSNLARIADSPASHELKDYAGTYIAPGYADIEIKRKDNELWGFYAGEWFKLLHYHYDIFELDRRETFGDTIKVSFISDSDGLINQLHFPIEPEVANTVFHISVVTSK